MAFKMKGSSLYGKMNLNRGGQASRPDGRAKSSAFQKEVKIGPAESPEAIKKKRQAYNEVPLGKENDAEYNKKRKAYKDAKSYEKEGAPMKKSPMEKAGGFDDVIEGFKTIGRTLKPSVKNVKKAGSDIKEGFRQLFTGDRTDSRTKKKKPGAPMSEDAKRDKAEYDAKQAKKAAKAKKEADHKKTGDDAMKYHQEQAKAQGISWPEYKRKLKKRTRGY